MEYLNGLSLQDPISHIAQYLPSHLTRELKGLATEFDELRLRSHGSCDLTLKNRNVALRTRLLSAELDTVFKKMCGGSLYAHRETICRGYVTLASGIRVGVCGRAVCENDKIVAVYDISSLCIRIPRRVTGIGDTVTRLLKTKNAGILIYSPPGVGKTTLLRAVTEALSKPPFPLRTALIDTRGEIGGCLPDGLCCDVLSGYPKGIGIEIAARTLNPELIICDELGGDMNEALAVKAAHNCGVPLLASSHASDIRELLRRTTILELHKAHIFDTYVGIRRSPSDKDYIYTVTSRTEAERLCF